MTELGSSTKLAEPEDSTKKADAEENTATDN